MKKRVVMLCTAVSLLLGACTTYSLEELRHTTPKGSPFQNALSHYYLEFAEKKVKVYDWYGSMHFADKGLVAAYGGEVGPEDLADWKLPEERRPELEKAREGLLAALTASNMQARPDLTAQAQFSFDCWVDYAAPNWQRDKLLECREQFLDALYELTPRQKEAQDKDHYVVYFQWGQTAIMPEAQKVIDEVVQALEPEANYDITLSGHSDASGGQKFNQILSQKRAEAVKKRLMAGGVKEAAIKIFAFGESDLAIKTADGAKESKNRRVEIVLSE